MERAVAPDRPSSYEAGYPLDQGPSSNIRTFSHT